MAWGVLDDSKTLKPPGTVLLDDVRKEMPDSTSPEFAHLKKDKNVILQPQPSDSVNDPLNWSLKRKVSILFILMVTTTAIGGILTMLGTAGRILSKRFHVPYPIIIKTLSPPGIISNAIALFFASAIAAVYGKRMGIVIGVFVIWINMLTGYYANSLTNYRNVAIVNGIFGAPIELLMSPIIADMIFVHQRGRLMAISAIVGVIGGDASHVISGNIIAKLGVKYLYIVSFSVMAPLVFCIYFFVWETTYTRKPIVEASFLDKTSNYQSASESDPGFTTDDKKMKVVETTEDIHNLPTIESRISFHRADGSALEPKHTLRQNLQIYRGRVTDRSIIKAFFQPFPLMVFPTVLFSTLVNGAFMTWTTISGIISHQVMLYPPYNLGPDTLAYIGLPGSAVSLIFALIAGFSSDKLIQWMARRNGGVYEPEFRLLMMAPAVLFSTLAFTLLGPLYASHASVPKLVITTLLFHVSGPFAHSASLTYIFDTMQNTTTEAFVATSLFKHIFLFLATEYVPTWFKQVGPIRCYQTLAVLNLCFASLVIPMYMFGKRLRGAASRNAFLSKAAGNPPVS